MGVDRAGIRLGDAVVISGAGPIGVISALCARSAGAEPLVITDIDQRRLDFARKTITGIRPLLVLKGQSPEELGQAIINLADMKPRVALECTGVESSVTAGIFSLEFGGVMYVIGVGSDRQNFPLMHLSVNEIDIMFQYRYANTWPKAIRLVNSGLLDVSSLVTHRFSLEESLKAFKTASNPKAGALKVMVAVNANESRF
jgi:L-iditol 2-dehydrogenase